MPPGTFVLRGGRFGGVSHLNNLRLVHETYGVWGICAAAEPGRTADEIARQGKFGSETYMTVLVDDLRSEGLDAIQEPGRDWPDALIVFPHEPISEEWDHLRDVMLRRPEQDNPTYKGRRS